MKTKGLSFAHFMVAHSVSATAMAYVLSWIFGGLTPMIAAVSLVYSVFRALSFTRAMRNSLEWRAPGGVHPWDFGELAVLTFVLFAAWKHFAWLMPSVPTSGTPAVTTLSLTNFGDLPLHLNYIRALASGMDFLPLNPLFASEPLRYPFGPNLYNALWECLGFNTIGHLFLTGFAMTVATLVLLRELGGVWAMAAFFLAGGAVTGLGEQDWKSLFLSVWITQRGMLWALPIGLMLLMYLRSHLSGQSRLPQKAVGGLGRMWGMFPFFHAHGFVVVSLLLFVLVRFDFGKTLNWSRTRDFLTRFFVRNRALYWAVAPATFFVFYTTENFSRSSVVRLKWLWTLPENSNLQTIVKWAWVNFGYSVGALLLVALGLFFHERFVEKHKTTEASRRFWWEEMFLYIAIFALGLVVMLAPWDWDNIKVLIWPWVLGFALVGRAYLALSERRPSWIWQVVSVVGVVVAFHRGAILLTESWKQPQEKAPVLWQLDQLANAETVLMKVSPKAIFAAAPVPSHPLAYFGRFRVMGYPGHLWSHGIEYAETEKDLDDFMNGSADWVERAKKLKLTHVYWGPEEKSKWGSTPRVWQERLALVAKSGEHEVYEFKEAK